MAIQAFILMAGSLLGVNQKLETPGLAARATSSLPEGRRTLPEGSQDLTVVRPSAMAPSAAPLASGWGQ